MKFVPVDNPLSAPVIEPAKPTMIDGGFWGPGLLAEVLANKYLYHLPLDRQRVLNLQRHGVDLSPNTMGDSVEKVADQCGILVARMKQRMLGSGYVRADETFIRYLDRMKPPCETMEPYLVDGRIEELPGAKPAEIDALLPANWAAANRDAQPAIKSNTTKVA